MKAKYTSLDIKLIIIELEKKLLGMRVNNVYDIDSKTYLIKLNKTDGKAMLLLESGIRFHTTEFEWPKHIIPSGFAMKMRKHLKGRRLESIRQLGVDRIVDFQFGSGEAAYHVILEVYDRGNIVLTDYEYNILNIQRPRTDNDKDVKFIVREKYPVNLAKQLQPPPSPDDMTKILESAKKGDNLRKVLNPHLIYGSHLLDHCLLEFGLKGNAKIGTDFQIARDLDKLMEALSSADEFMQHCSEKVQQGYIINQKEKNVSDKEQDNFVLTYSEFHPFLFSQHSNEPFNVFESFDKAIDEFFSKIESQKQDRKINQQKTTALKKLEHIKLDNQNRITGLKDEQLNDLKRAWLLELNLELVDEVITMMRNALAHQMDWNELKAMIEDASSMNDIVGAIKSLKLDINHVTLLLKPPENVNEDGFDLTPMKIDIDLGLSAYSNARKYYDMKRHAAVKEVKTSDALHKAYKSVEKKTLQVLKEVQMVATINKARKTHWFEKFLWFISSENYVVIGGRDQQQNELIVKRHLKPGDIYVHADLHGASSIVIKNPTKKPVPPVTLDEAGAMALCNSAAWDARVVTSSWWVYHDQVSKTAPTGEYLTTGSFMIRGKKNYLLPASLIYGFGFLFKLDETCLDKHKNERRVKGKNDDDDDDGSDNQPQEEVVLEEDSKDDDDNDDDVNDSSNVNKQEKVTETNETQDDENADTSPDNHGDDNDDAKEEEEEELHNGTTKDGCQNEAEVMKNSDNEFETFPDTEIKAVNLLSLSSDAPTGVQQDETNVGGGKNMRMSAKQRRDAKKHCNEGKNEDKEKEEDKRCMEDSRNGSKTKALTNAQRNKLKKIKKKYGDQDEEERELKMQLLAPDRPPNENTVKRHKKHAENMEKTKLHGNHVYKGNKKPEVKKKVDLEAIKTNPDEIIIDLSQPDAVVVDDDVDDETDNKQVQQEMELLDSLTGIPLPDDVLHYCIPVCAPWNALKNYRFKVKLIPGTCKRGKASKMAIGMFMQDKTTTSLEKDLFRSVKDIDLSRNMPGKVKVSVTKHSIKK